MERSTFAVHAAFIRGVEAHHVSVEVSMAGGIPSMSIVGMADTVVLEARSRVRCALRAAGFSVPRKSITVNLAPGNVRKTGSGFDLPIAVALLAASGQIPIDELEHALFVGELALDGSVSAVPGDIAFQVLAREMGLKLVSACGPGMVLDGCEAYGVSALSCLRAGVFASPRISVSPHAFEHVHRSQLDYRDVVGQEMAKRGMMIAATGDLGVLMVGAPGSGKSMLAQRICGILPPIDDALLQDALCIHSVAGEPLDDLLGGMRPFRSPHHSISAAGLMGGGRPVRPGEISLAHGGALFLDEIAEFSPGVLQGLRQPMEEGVVRIVRVSGVYAFPASFKLVAACNPCPCGFLGDRERSCTCSPQAIVRYQARMGGPLIDRIDLVIPVTRPDAKLIVNGAEGMSTSDMRAAVMRGREFRAWRLLRTCDHEQLGCDARDALLAIANAKRLTARGIASLVRIARSVADLAQCDDVTREHLLEASLFHGGERTP